MSTTVLLLVAVPLAAAIAFVVGRALGVRAVAPAAPESGAGAVGRQRMLALLELSTDFVAIAGPDGELLYLNRAGRRMLGEGEDLDLSALELGRCFVDRRAFDKAMAEARGRGFWAGEATVACVGVDVEVHLSQSLIAHRDRQGEVEFFSTIGRDVTQRRQVARLKSELIATVSHELRTPLTSIHGALRLIEAGGEAVAGKRDELLGVALVNTERLTGIVEDMLDLGELDAGQLELDRAPQRAERLAAEALERVAAAAEDRGVAVTRQVAEGLVVDGDRRRLVQVLVNLLDNAIKYSEANDTVRLTVGPIEGDRVRFAVRDEGPGVDEEDFSRVFHTFSRLDAADTREQGGTGLGLAVSRAIIEQHGGEIGVESPAGMGSEFYFCLAASVINRAQPLAEADEEP